MRYVGDVKRTIVLFFAAGLLLGCDLDSLFADAADAAEKKADAEKKAGATEKADDASADVDEATKHLPGPAAECVAACDADTTLSATDRATCRLNCEQKGGTAAPTAGESALRDFSACADGCDAKSKTDAETCRLNCANKAGAALAAKNPEASDEFRTCASGCLEDMSACRAGCPDGEAGATCRVRCESEAQRCVGTCTE